MDKDDYNGSKFSSLTSSLFSPCTTSPPTTPSAAATEEAVAAGSTRLYRARLILENHLYDELQNRYRLAIARLRELTREANALQEENEWLRLANDDLNRRLSRLQGSSSEQTSERSSSSPTSVINDGTEERFTLPKSISVRSSDFFKLINPPPSPSQRVNGTRLRVQREENAVEMDMYNQGMYKTELCNKWQETGTCPYDNNCQFAHGVSELRPVVRHPRYKTQVCRMVLAGVTCPYGHRCHFRHALPPSNH